VRHLLGHDDAWLQDHTGEPVLIGMVAALGGGRSRHFALLFAVLAGDVGVDRAFGIPFEVRMRRGWRTAADGTQAAHTWNEVVCDGGMMVIDPYHDSAMLAPDDVVGVLRGMDRDPETGCAETPA
jgi:hypothetical protein